RLLLEARELGASEVLAPAANRRLDEVGRPEEDPGGAAPGGGDILRQRLAGRERERGVAYAQREQPARGARVLVEDAQAMCLRQLAGAREMRVRGLLVPARGRDDGADRKAVGELDRLAGVLGERDRFLGVRGRVPEVAAPEPEVG